jgi:DNA-binding SARP family transcriptional activator
VLLAERPLSRRELSADLFPETVDPLGSLRWCLASLRKAVGSPDVFVGDPVLPALPDWVTVDIAELERGEVDADLTGEFLEGVDPVCGPGFDTWLLVTRHHVAARVAARLRESTIVALSRADHAAAVAFARAGVQRSPYDEGAQVLLVKSLTMSGLTDAAVRHIEQVEALFRADLGVVPSAALRSAARPMVSASPPGVSLATLAASSLSAGAAAIAAGAIEAGIDCLRRAAGQAESAGDTQLLGACLLELGSALVHSVRGFDDEGGVVLEQSAALAAEVGDLATLIAALRERGYADTLAGRRPEARERLDRATELAAGRANLLAGLHAVGGLNESDWGHHRAAIEHYGQALEHARSSGDQRWEAWALGLGSWAALMAGDLDGAAEWAESGLDAVRNLRWASFEPWPMSVLAECRLVAGSSPSFADLERGFAMSCQLEDPCWEGASGRVIAMHHAQRGDYDSAASWITEARTRAVRRTDTWMGVVGAVLATEIDIRRDAGDPAAATSAARELIALAARTQLDGFLTYGVAALG